VKLTGRLVMMLITFTLAMSLNAYLMSIHSLNIYIIVISCVAVVLSWYGGKHYDQVRDEAERDSLTTAYRRRTAYLLFDRLQQKVRRTGQAVAVFFIDINDFKLINDHYGHAVGDVMLRKTVEALMEVNSRQTHVVRFGGDEFLVLTLCDSEAELEDTHQEMVERLESIPALTAVSLTVSIGRAWYPQQSTRLDDLIDSADQEMMHAKRRVKQGRRNTAVR